MKFELCNIFKCSHKKLTSHFQSASKKLRLENEENENCAYESEACQVLTSTAYDLHENTTRTAFVNDLPECWNSE